jgi:hypothetical protein
MNAKAIIRMPGEGKGAAMNITSNSSRKWLHAAAHQMPMSSRI